MPVNYCVKCGAGVDRSAAVVVDGNLACADTKGCEARQSEGKKTEKKKEKEK